MEKWAERQARVLHYPFVSYAPCTDTQLQQLRVFSNWRGRLCMSSNPVPPQSAHMSCGHSRLLSRSIGSDEACCGILIAAVCRGFHSCSREIPR
jgi:hypothetical protein